MKYVTRIIRSSGKRVWLDARHLWTSDYTKAKEFEDEEAKNHVRRLHYQAETVDTATPDPINEESK